MAGTLNSPFSLPIAQGETLRHPRPIYILSSVHDVNEIVDFLPFLDIHWRLTVLATPLSYLELQHLLPHLPVRIIFARPLRM